VIRNLSNGTFPGLVIFDCDGVLVDSEHIDARIRSECFRARGFEVTSEDLLANPGTSRAGLEAMIEQRFGRSLPVGFMEATRAKILSAFTEELRAIDGVAQLLETLSIPTCVASNSHPDRTCHSLKVTDLWGFFDPHVFSAEMVTKAKPAPDLFLFAAEQMNATPGDCLVVEDSVNGVRAARAAEMEVIGFCGASHCAADQADLLLSAGCTRVFSRMTDLRAFLRSPDER
jgi:HAD superfamily hydrolase (TIGR01509 family)